MNKWMNGIRGMVLMILLWVVGWALGFGGLIEAFVDPSGDIIDIWFTAMAIPGLMGGIVFATLVRIAEGNRSLDDLPVIRYAVWGAVAGLVIGTIAMVRGIELTLTTGKIFAITTVLGIVAGVGTGLFFRIAARSKTDLIAN